VLYYYYIIYVSFIVFTIWAFCDCYSFYSKEWQLWTRNTGKPFARGQSSPQPRSGPAEETFTASFITTMSFTALNYPTAVNSSKQAVWGITLLFSLSFLCREVIIFSWIRPKIRKRMTALDFGHSVTSSFLPGDFSRQMD